MSTIRTKIKIGSIEAEIECTEDQLQTTVEGMIATIVQRLQEFSQTSETRIRLPKSNTCKEELNNLLRESWFASCRYVREAHVELAKRGYHYHCSAVSHALTDLVKDGILCREGLPRRYKYIQRSNSG